MTRKIEKRPIRTLGFFIGENFFSSLLKGFGLGSKILFLLTLARFGSLGQYRLESIHLNPYSLAFVVLYFYPIWISWWGTTEEVVALCLALPHLASRTTQKLAVLISSLLLTLLHISTWVSHLYLGWNLFLPELPWFHLSQN